MFCFDFRGLSPGHVGRFVVVVIGHCPAMSDCFCYGGCEPPSGHVGDCYGRGRHPRCIGAGRSTSVRTAPARPAQPSAVRCVRTLFAPVLKRRSPSARGQQVLSLPMAGGLAAVCFGLYHCGCSGFFGRPFTGFCFPQSRAAAVENPAPPHPAADTLRNKRREPAGLKSFPRFWQSMLKRKRISPKIRSEGGQ